MIKQNCPIEARTQRGNIKYLDKLRELSRTNRNTLTKAEGLTWHTILKKDKLGYHFVRQKPIGRYILDFYCSKLLLAIEIDGSSHELKENQDIVRDQYIAIRGIKTIRYSNYQVLKQLENVFLDIQNQIKIREKELTI